MVQKNAEVAAFSLVVLFSLTLHDWIHHKKSSDLVIGAICAALFVGLYFYRRARI